MCVMPDACLDHTDRGGETLLVLITHTIQEWHCKVRVYTGAYISMATCTKIIITRVAQLGSHINTHRPDKPRGPYF